MQSYTKFKEICAFPRLPLEGNLDVTYRCNNNCRHCWVRLPQQSMEKLRELSTDEIKLIIDEARRLGCTKWSISGGEPMLRPDFPEIFEYITKNSSSYSINTNGTLITPEIAELMRRKGRKMIALYGATAEVHDHITRNPGSFQATMKGLDLLREAGAEFTVQLIPMKDNYHQFNEMVELARSRSHKWRVGAAWLFLSAEGDPKRNKEIELQRLDPKDVIELDKPEISDDNRPDEFVHSSEDDRFFASCIDKKLDFHIDSYGCMSFCSFIRDPKLRYNLREGNLQDCWETFIPSLKDRIKGGQQYRNNCGSCDLKNECRWCPAYGYLEHRNFSAPIKYLCQVAREGRRFRDDWEKNHCRYFKCADITIKIEYDLPITEKTFHPTFSLFQTDNPGEDKITIKHHFEVPNLDGKDLGEAVYERKGWKVYRKGNSWIYLIPSMGKENTKKVAIFNKDHTRANVYRNNIVMTENEDPISFYLDDISITQISLAYLLADREGFFLHSSGVVIDGKGILFVGHSGAGKSTLRNIALLKEGIEPLCDDRNVLRKGPAGYKIYGTWAYKDLPNVQATSVPLSALMFLEQAKENLIIPIEDRLEVSRRLLPCVIRPVESTEWWNKTLTVVDEIVREIPCYVLRFDLTGRIINQLKSLCQEC